MDDSRKKITLILVSLGLATAVVLSQLWLHDDADEERAPASIQNGSENSAPELE